MTNHEQTQADLLDQFRQNTDGTPPAGLDAGIAAVAVMLEDQLSPPVPSAGFVQNLGRQLDAEASHTGNRRQARSLPPLPGQTIPPSTPPNDLQTDGHDEPRRSWIFEAGRIAAAGLAIALVGTILMLVFRDADEVVAPGAGETVAHPGEILISWDPNGGEDYKLFVVDTDSGEVRKLNYGSAESGGVVSYGPAEADGISERYASWSPDGQRIAFVREEAGQSDIIVMNADGSNPQNVTNSPYNEGAPIWSPDGSRIAFEGETAGVGDRNIYIANADGTDVRQISSAPGAALFPNWSPDGSQIAFLRLNQESTSSISVANSDGSGERLITELGSMPVVSRPQWSPSGQHIAFSFESDIWIVTPDGSVVQRLPAGEGGPTLPGWSPDGERLAYVRGSFEDGANEIVVAHVENELRQEWMTGGDIATAPSWSPEETQLAFWSGSGIDHDLDDPWEDVVWQLIAASPDGSNERSLLTGRSIDTDWPPSWRPPVTGETPSPWPAATPTPIAPTPITEAGTDRIYVVTSNGVTVTDPATGDEIYSTDIANGPDAALSPDGSRLYVLGAGGVDELVAFDASDGSELWRVTVEDRIRWMFGLGPSTLSVSPDGSRIYLYSSNAPDVHWIQIFDTATGERIDETETMAGYCPAMLHPLQGGDDLFLACQRSRFVNRVDLNELRPTNTANLSGPITGSVMSPDGTMLYVVSLDGAGFEVTVFSDAPNPGIPQPLADDEQPPVLGQMVTLSPDGKRLYVALGVEDNDGDSGTQDVREIAVFATTRWTEIDRITLDVPLKGGAFTMSPDGRYIYASERLPLDSDGKLIRIDVESGETSTVLVRNAEILRVLVGGQAEPERESFPSEPPPATIAYGDQSQVQESFNYCWAEASGSMRCVESDMAPPSEPALSVPVEASLTFTVDGIDQFQILGAYVHPLVTANGQLTWGHPTIDVPFDQSAPPSTISADLPTGEYVLAVQIEVPLYPDNPGTATYFFRVAVYDEESGRPPESEIVPSGLVEFDRFPVWSLGETFGEFVLDGVVEHHHDSSGENVSFEFVYVAEDGRTDVGIQVTSRGSLSEAELQTREESRQGLGEAVVVNGETGWLTPVDDNATMIELDRSDGSLTIVATDRETALTAAEAVQQVNGT